MVEDLCHLFPRVAMHGKCPASPAMAFRVPFWSAGGGSGTALLPDITYVGQLPPSEIPIESVPGGQQKDLLLFLLFFELYVQSLQRL